MAYPEVLGQLLESGQAELAAWFAVPLSVSQARAGLDQTRQGLRGARVLHQRPFATRLAEFIFRFWAGYDSEANYRNCLALLDSDRDLALLELCYGQLLIACRQEPAWRHLDTGFTTAARLLEPEDYFTVLKRHELLRQLPLATGPSPATSLDALLAEARVIARLRGPGVRPGTHRLNHCDTIG